MTAQYICLLIVVVLDGSRPDDIAFPTPDLHHRRACGLTRKRFLVGRHSVVDPAWTDRVSWEVPQGFTQNCWRECSRSWRRVGCGLSCRLSTWRMFKNAISRPCRTVLRTQHSTILRRREKAPLTSRLGLRRCQRNEKPALVFEAIVSRTNRA